MGSIFNSMATVADSMRAMQTAIETAGNNVTNAKTPNFAKQRLDLQARRFEVNRGLAGGVEGAHLVSSRNAFLEQTVQQQSQRYGRFAQQSASLEQIEPIFDITSGAGIVGSIDRLFQSFSALSVGPNDATARQAVLDRAGELSRNFRSTTATLAAATSDGQNDLRSTVEKINAIGRDIQKYNNQVREDARNLEDPGLDARVYGQLESLSELVDFDVVRSADGSFNVNLGGQTPLTVGSHYFPVSVDFGGPTAVLRNAQGGDITGQIKQGRLRAQLDTSASFLPTLTADLNRLAATLAGSVNSTLAAGLDQAGNPPSTDLFRYDVTAGAAASLSVNALTPGQLAAASSGAPSGNGNALALSDLAHAPLVDNLSPSQFIGSLAGRVGSALANSRSDEKTQGLLLAQARNQRAKGSEVSLDEEAASLVAFQKQYEANSELFRILSSLTETTLNLVR